VFDSLLCIKFYLLTSVKSSYCVSQNPGNFGYSSIVRVQVDSGEINNILSGINCYSKNAIYKKVHWIPVRIGGGV